MLIRLSSNAHLYRYKVFNCIQFIRISQISKTLLISSMKQFENVYLSSLVMFSNASINVLAFISQCLPIQSVFMNLVRGKGPK